MVSMTFVRRVATVALLSLLPLASGAGARAESLTPVERAEVETIVRDYVLAHPEIIVEALEILQAREQAEATELQRRQITELGEEIFDDPATPVLGNPDGDVTLVEFLDYQCGYCKRMLEEIFALIDEDANLRIVFKELPILGPASVTAAQAALASREQGLYGEFHRALMSYRGRLSDDLIFQLAEDVGLDVDRLRRDMESDAIQAHIAGNLALAQSLGIRGTPAFIIGDEVIPGAVGGDALRELIAQARQG